MFESNYYCLVASLKEYSLESDTKGFDPRAIIDLILEEVTSGDRAAVELLYTYYDCDNLVALRNSSSAFNPLGNLTQEALAEESEHPTRLPLVLRRIIEAYNNPESEEVSEYDFSRGFERDIWEAYYAECARSRSSFLRAWSEFDRTLRNVAAAIQARATGRSIEECTVGEGFVVEQLRKSSAADFALRGEVAYLDNVISIIGDEGNILDKEHKVDMIRWSEASTLATFDYFNIDSLLSYLVRINIVARWSRLNEKIGREMLKSLLADLSGKDLIK